MEERQLIKRDDFFPGQLVGDTPARAGNIAQCRQAAIGTAQAGRMLAPRSGGLFERRLDGGKRGFKMGAKPGNRWDDRYRDSRRNQTILNRCRRGFVPYKGFEFS